MIDRRTSVEGTALAVGALATEATGGTGPLLS